MSTEISEQAPGSQGDYARVLDFIRQQLLSGRIRVGDKLVAERELSALLGVSRPVLREALRALSMIGAVEIRHGVGTFVTTPDVSALGDFFSLVLAQQGDQLDDILESRVAIEHHAIRLACRRATETDYDRLAATLGRIRETIEDAEEGAKADFAFHSAIVAASHSKTLATIYGALSNFIVDLHVVRRRRILTVSGIRDYLIDHHARILDALVRRDGPEADRLLAEHFEIGADFSRRAMLNEINGASR
ncbi:GntR family transcriptional regulator [Devosia yakushimensis]|uniref:GntR family transcriptional regulator n=1 Tax=Devosia yakushimensis TaxID=470028 RepID=A0ABQ5U933_9HYPH|nr:FadR/GntR family transcriptional regulator [Devosia yakushimensis]GLQ08173.1 GntR family transcriptional regulator [Devosia yakushimensis]